MEKKDNRLEQEKKRIVSLARYSAMSFQMLAIIGLAVWGGIKLDKIVTWKFPVFTLVLSLVGVFLALAYFIQDINRLNSKK